MVKKAIFYQLLLILVILFSANDSYAPLMIRTNYDRSHYLASISNITRPEEIIIDEYIGSMDYNYPIPLNDFAIYPYVSNNQISNKGQELLIQLGIRASKIDFEKLPPLNIAFVIDKSGSMSEQNKMTWVKKSFKTFIDKMRNDDIVSLITYSDNGEVLFEGLNGAIDDKQRAIKLIDSITPDGKTNILSGLKLAYKSIESRLDKKKYSIIILLTDGVNNVGSNQDILSFIETIKEKGIYLSTFGLGKDYDHELLNGMSKKAEGSYRFISSPSQIEKLFNEELDRIIIPAFKHVNISIGLKDDVEIIETWGYENIKKKNEISYHLDTLYNRDFETILLKVRTKKTARTGKEIIATVKTSFLNKNNMMQHVEPIPIMIEYVNDVTPTVGISNGTVLRAGTMLNYAKALWQIGNYYHSTSKDNSSLESALKLTCETKKDLVNADLRLNSNEFEKDIELLMKYIDIIGKELNLPKERISSIKNDNEIQVVTPNRKLINHLNNLIKEIELNFKDKNKKGIIALAGFKIKNSSKQSSIELILDNIAITSITNNTKFTLVDRENIEKILNEQKLSYSLSDNPIKIGKILSANYFLKGTIVPMKESAIIFGQLINIESSQIESAAQIIVERTDEFDNLMRITDN